nr:MAG TPA_asm: hypothetical protein [Caudoviricetes sp.]
MVFTSHYSLDIFLMNDRNFFEISLKSFLNCVSALPLTIRWAVFH